MNATELMNVIQMIKPILFVCGAGTILWLICLRLGLGDLLN